MILLDTNVLSEAMRQAPDAKVLAWLDAQVIETLGTTAITIAELASGIAALPASKKRRALQDKFDVLLATLESRVLPFDAPAALKFGQVISQAKTVGYGIGHADAQIAAIALTGGHTTGHTVATRDTAPFLAVGVKVINPWA